MNKRTNSADEIQRNIAAYRPKSKKCDIITDCTQCSWVTRGMCGKLQRKIVLTEEMTFPDWCPLEDVITNKTPCCPICGSECYEEVTKPMQPYFYVCSNCSVMFKDPDKFFRSHAN